MDMKQEPPICKECAHFVAGPEGLHKWELAKCSTTLGPRNPVSGVRAPIYCELERKTYGSCGPDGKLFEPSWQKEAA